MACELDRDEALRVVDDYADSFRPDFRDWLIENFHVFAEFVRRSLRIASHRSHYSARTIAETIRHDSTVRELNGEYKINNNAVPDLARLFTYLHPEHTGLFEFREHKAAA